MLITKTKFEWLLLRGLIEWPPFVMDGKIYGKKCACEDTPAGFVWCDV